MTDEQLGLLKKKGFDIDGAMERFLNNRDMYEKFLHKFQKETTFAELCSKIEAKDTAGAFAAAHSLKGVSANLSLQAFFHQISVQVEFLRDGDLPPAAAMMPEVKKAYEETQQIISEVLGND